MQRYYPGGFGLPRFFFGRGLVFSCTLFFLYSSNGLIAQASQKENKDIHDVLMNKKKKAAAANDTSGLEVGRNYISLLPVIGYAPANGVLLGAAISFSKLLGPGPTNVSSGMLNAQLTSKNQFIINARSKIFLPGNAWYLQGDWRLLFFSQPTYGLGINGTNGSNFVLTINGLNHTTEDRDSLVQDMRFNYVRIYEDVARKIGNNWYAGLGYALDYHFQIEDNTLQADPGQPNFRLTDHYVYSLAHGFNPKAYVTSGINFNILHDSRDNVANAYKGYLISFSLRLNPTFLGSSKNSSMLSYDARYFCL